MFYVVLEDSNGSSPWNSFSDGFLPTAETNKSILFRLLKTFKTSFWQESESESESECLWGRSRESESESEFLKGWSWESESESEFFGAWSRESESESEFKVVGVESRSRSRNS